MKRLAPTAALMACLLLPGSVPAQGAAGPGPGARVRITAPALSVPVAGMLLDTAGGFLVFKADRWSDPMKLDRSSITAVEVPVGSHRHVGQGALVGIAAGIGLGAAFGYMGGDDPPCSPHDVSNAEPWGASFLFILLELTDPCVSRSASDKATSGALVSGLIGLALGAAVGAAHRTDGWAQVNAPSSTSAVSVAPLVGADRRFGLAFRLPTR